MSIAKLYKIWLTVFLNHSDDIHHPSPDSNIPRGLSRQRLGPQISSIDNKVLENSTLELGVSEIVREKAEHSLTTVVDTL